MARKQEEIIKQISVDTRWVNGGHIRTKTSILFESGRRYATSILGFDQRFEKFSIGDKVIAIIVGDNNILHVQKA